MGRRVRVAVGTNLVIEKRIGVETVTRIEGGEEVELQVGTVSGTSVRIDVSGDMRSDGSWDGNGY